ncbi:MAG: carboxypeptidase-like regulatory domain-containing protein, partial [Flavobacteriales bacterium]|nr:carboxypeptidase-like regulatory domain-containing protein [Flavobacteriales bacterium]
MLVMFFLSFVSHAQQRGKVVSFNTKKPITGAVVKWTNGKQFAVTDENGEFAIPISNNGYVVQSIGYYDYSTT